MLKVTKAQLEITETELRQILQIVDDTKKQVEFINKPMPFGDMDIETAKMEEIKRGKLTISPMGPGISFKVIVDNKTREYALYHLDGKIPQKRNADAPSVKIHE